MIFTPLSAKIFGGLSAALLIALGVLWLLYGAQGKRLKDCRQEVGRVEERLKVSNASVDEGLRQISAQNQRINEANARLEQTKQQAAADLARSDARWETQKGRVSALEASAKDNSQPPCKVSQRAAQALEGL